MKIHILLHSSTGNTRLMTRWAARRLELAGHEVTVQDIVREREIPRLDEVDLLGVSCPTMYFRPTVAMERFVARLPDAAPGPRPAFLLATAGGDTGSHFAILAEILARKGWITLGARFVQFVDNWPPHQRLGLALNTAFPLVEALVRRNESARWWLHWMFPNIGEPQLHQRTGLGNFLDDLLRQAASGHLEPARDLRELDRGWTLFKVIGRLMTVNEMRLATGIRLDEARCDACGTCVTVCPVDCLTRPDKDAIPTVGPDCTGCWACFNHCPEGAISAWACDHGAGRYQGPSREARELYRVPPRDA